MRIEGLHKVCCRYDERSNCIAEQIIDSIPFVYQQNLFNDFEPITLGNPGKARQGWIKRKSRLSSKLYFSFFLELL